MSYPLDKERVKQLRIAAFKEAAEVAELTLDELNDYLTVLEAPLIEELAAVSSDQNLTVGYVQRRKCEIRDARYQLEQVRKAWHTLNPNPDAGPTQSIGI